MVAGTASESSQVSEVQAVGVEWTVDAVKQHQKLHQSVLGFYLLRLPNLSPHQRQRKPSNGQVRTILDSMVERDFVDANQYLTAIISEESPVPESRSPAEAAALLPDVKAEVIAGGHRWEAMKLFWKKKGEEEGSGKVHVKLLSRGELHPCLGCQSMDQPFFTQ